MHLFLLSNPRERIDARVLGALNMSAAMPTEGDRNGGPADREMNEIFALVRRAIDRLDAMNAPPELAARLQEALDLMAGYRS